MTSSLLVASVAALALQAGPGATTTTVVSTQHTHVVQRVHVERRHAERHHVERQGEHRRTEVRWQTGESRPTAQPKTPWVAQRRDRGRRGGGRRGHGRRPGHHHDVHDGRGNPACNNLRTMAAMAVGFVDTRDDVEQLAQWVCSSGFDIPRQWPNGRIGRMSDTTWYWPNGRLLRNGKNTFYWPNGRLAQNGKNTFYWPNGRLARNGTNTRYWPNGRLAQNGKNTWYWPSGRLAKNGTNTYFTPDGRMLRDRGSFLYAVCAGQERACRRRGSREMTMPELLGLGWR